MGHQELQHPIQSSSPWLLCCAQTTITISGQNARLSQPFIMVYYFALAAVQEQVQLGKPVNLQSGVLHKVAVNIRSVVLKQAGAPAMQAFSKMHILHISS